MEKSITACNCSETVYSMGRASLLDKISNIWARPICSTKDGVNGNEAHLLDKLLRFGTEGLFNRPHVVTPSPPPTDYVGAIPHLVVPFKYPLDM